MKEEKRRRIGSRGEEKQSKGVHEGIRKRGNGTGRGQVNENEEREQNSGDGDDGERTLKRRRS